MNRVVRFISGFSVIVILTIEPVHTIDYGETLTDPVLEQRAKHLYAQVRCPTCVGQSVEGSSSQMAQDLRTEIRQQLLVGSTDDAIIKSLQNRYGAAITYDPAVNPQTWLLWGLPFVLIILGGLIFIMRYRRHSQGQ